MHLQPGTRLGPYEIVAPIGAGGMGEVYRARDTRLDRTVAVKVLPSELAQDARFRIRFEREAKAISALNHPHICTLYDVGDSYLVMEYCEGTTLAERVALGPLSVEEAVRYGAQIADALDKAHQHGIIHRDLKPSNIMLTGAGVKLLDFGLAKRRPESSTDSATAEMVSEDGALLGTVQYMAPEVLRGSHADARSDVYAFGLVLYEIVTGKRAFDGPSKAGIIAAILERDPTPVAEINPTTPAALDLLIRACLAKNPADRVQTANDVSLQLRAMSDGAVAVTPRARLYASTSMRKASARPRAMAVFIAAAILAAAAGVWMWRRNAPAAPSPIASLVILPFENLSKPEDDHLNAGLHDSVIGELSQISGWRLISRTSAMHYRNTNKTVPQIARDLNVDGVVEGSVSRSGADLRIQVKLIRARPEERPMWSRTYETKLRSVAALPAEIARAVAAASGVALTPDETARLSRPRALNPDTYESYLKGMYHVRKLTPESAQKGLAYLTEVVQKDPSDAAAHAGLALAYSIISHGPSPPSDVYARVKQEASKALELDDTVAEAHAALGAIAMFRDWDWASAERELKRAIELDPNLAHARRDYGWFLELRGPNAASVAEMQRAKEIDPLTQMYTADLAWLYFRAGRLDDAVKHVRSAVELEPTSPNWQYYAALIYSERGLHDEAIAAGKRAAGISARFKFALAYALARAGRTGEAENIAREIARDPAPMNNWRMAYVYAALGRKDEAFRRLEQALEARVSLVPWIKHSPGFAPLRADPRFDALVRRLNLPG